MITHSTRNFIKKLKNQRAQIKPKDFQLLMRTNRLAKHFGCPFSLACTPD